MKLLRAHFMGKPIIRAHFMGREIKLDGGDVDVRGRANSGMGIGSLAEGYQTDAIFGEARTGGGIGDAARGVAMQAKYGTVNTGNGIGDHAVGKVTSEAAARADSGIGIGNAAKAHTSDAKCGAPSGGAGLGDRAKAYSSDAANGRGSGGAGIGAKATANKILLHTSGNVVSGGGIGAHAVGAVSSAAFGAVRTGLGLGFAGEGEIDEGTTPTEVSFRPYNANQTIEVMFTQSAAGAVRIEWGDGVSSISGDVLSYTTLSHTYSGLRTYQNYTLQIYCKSGETWIPTTNENGFVNPSAGSSDLVRAVRFGYGVTEIGPRACANWRELTSVEMSNGITKIGASAFEYSTVRSLTLSTSLVDIQADAFRQTYQLEGTLVIPQGVSTIRAGVFAQSNANIHLPRLGMSAISTEAFWRHNGPWYGTQITADSGVGGCRAVNNCLIAGTTLIVCAGTASIPETEGITTIRYGALMNYTDITIPASVTSIDASNIVRHWGVHTMTLLSTTPPTLNGPITNTGTFTYLVQAASLSAYQTAQYWSEVASQIQAIPE